MGPTDLPHEAEWRSSVRVTEDRALARELADRWARGSGLRSVGVTDLVEPRRAFWRRAGPPVEFPPERRVAVETGRGLHRLLGRALAGEGTLEARVRRGGIVGRIDLLADVPTEVKTGASTVDPEALRDARPEQVEQVAMYCALLGNRSGRLLQLLAPEGAVEAVRAMDVKFDDLTAVEAEMDRRARALRDALVAGAPAELPRCRWFSRGCEYRAASVCDCRGDEPEPGSAMRDHLLRVAPRPDVEARVKEALARTSVPSGPPEVERFRDLLYLRRTYFERAPPPVLEAEEPPGPAPGSATPDSYGRLVEAIEGGPVGEVHRLASLADEPAEEVTGFRGEPYLARSWRSWDRLPAEQLLDRYPQYGLDLGFRCAVSGSYRGRVIVAYERAERDEDRIAVYELRFSSLTPLSRSFRSRADALRDALARRDPLALPPCPSWMYADCPYRGACGCGDDVGRSQR